MYPRTLQRAKEKANTQILEELSFHCLLTRQIKSLVSVDLYDNETLHFLAPLRRRGDYLILYNILLFIHLRFPHLLLTKTAK